jgi:hypothetical protein
MQQLTRADRARVLFNEGVRPVENGRDSWSVQGSSVYEVRCDDGLWSCSCFDFSMRGAECKHIMLVKLCVSKTKFKPPAAAKCDRCIEARHGGPAEFSAGLHVWCSHTRALVEPQKKETCEWFADRSELIIV